MTNQNTQPTLQVTRDGQPDYEYMPVPPSPVEALQAAVADKLNQFTGHVVLQARMALFDRMHGTNYRHIRNTLVEQEKRRSFADSIGLILIDKSKKSK